MLKVNKKIETNKSKSLLKKKIEEYIKRHNYIFCPELGRKVFLSKWLEINNQYGRQPVMRMQSFFVGLELINKYRGGGKIKKEDRELEIKGKDGNGKLVIVHIREESQRKNRLLFYISSYHHTKK